MIKFDIHDSAQILSLMRKKSKATKTNIVSNDSYFLITSILKKEPQVLVDVLIAKASVTWPLVSLKEHQSTSSTYYKINIEIDKNYHVKYAHLITKQLSLYLISETGNVKHTLLD